MADLTLAFKIAVDSAAAQAAFGRFAAEARTSLTSIATTSSTTDAALKTLGVRSTATLQAELASLRSAYVTVSNSGTANLRDIRAATAALKAKTQELNQELAGNKVAGLNSQLSAGLAPAQAYAGGIGAIAHKMLAWSAAIVSVRSGLDLVQGIVNTGAKFETLGAQLKTLYGDSAQAQTAVDWIQQFTKDTPFELDGVTQSFVKLKAFGLDPMDGTMQAIVDQSSALGASQENLQGIVLALGQAWVKQKLQGEEILQLVEHGVPVWDLLAKATGKNTAELQELSQQGKLGRDVIRALIDEMGKVNAGASAEQMKTFNGQLSNLKDTWTQFENTIAKSGLLDYLNKELVTINTRLAEMDASGELKTRAKEISDALISMISVIKSVGTTLYDLRQEIGLVIAAWVGFKALKGSVALFDLATAAAARLTVQLGLLKAGTTAAGAATTATSIKTLGTEAATALTPMRALTLLKFTPWVGLAATIAYLYEAKKAADDAYAALQKAKADQVRDLKTTADINASGEGAAVATKAELEKMNAYEIASYAERLDQARKFYAAKVELATTDKGIDPAQAKFNLEQKHLYDQALADLKAYQSDRSRAETDFNTRLNGIKTAQTQIITNAIADQLRKYQEANKALADLQKQRADIEAKFQQSADGLGTPKNAPAPDIVAVQAAVQKAQGLQQDGDLKGAAAAAEQARQLIDAANAAGTVSDYFLKDFLNRAKDVALEVNQAQQSAAQSQIEGYKASIEALKSAADWMKQLTIGYDTAAALKSTADLQAQLQALMAQNPLVQKVVVQKLDAADTGANNIVNTGDVNTKNPSSSPSTPGYATGGLITGPGTGTSDSILARLSHGEFVQNHAAVRYYGVDFMHALNNLRLPKFARGGLVANLDIPALTGLGQPGGMVAGSSGNGSTIYLTIGGQQHGPLTAEDSVAKTLKRAAAMFGAAR